MLTMTGKKAFDKLVELFPRTQIICLAFKTQPEKPVLTMVFKRMPDAVGCFLFTEGKASPTYAEVHGTGMDLRFDALQQAIISVLYTHSDIVEYPELLTAYHELAKVVDTNSLNVVFDRVGLIRTSFEI